MRKVSSVRKKLKNTLVNTFYNKLMTRKLNSPAVMTCEELSSDDVERLRKKVEKNKQQLQKRPAKRLKTLPKKGIDQSKIKKRRTPPPPPPPPVYPVYKEPEISFILQKEEEDHAPPMITYEFEQRHQYIEETFPPIPQITYEFEEPAEPIQYNYLYIPC